MWVMPTMGRPKQCAAVFRAIIAIGNSTPGIVVVNGTKDMEEYLQIKLPPLWKMVILPENIGCCGAMNWAFRNYPDEPFYGLMCDDEYVYSSGWDKRLTEACGTKYISHGNDRWQSGKRQHAYVTFGGDLIRFIGFWALPGLWHWFHDDCWEHLSNGLDNTRFCQDVYCEHRHYLAGKAEKDDTYKSGESRNGIDHMIFQRWLITEYPAVKKRLIEFYGDNKEKHNG